MQHCLILKYITDKFDNGCFNIKIYYLKMIYAFQFFFYFFRTA